MDEHNDEAPEETPSFVTDEAASAGTEKRSVAPDDAGQDEIDDAESRPPDAFAVEDAITKTAVDPPTTADE